MPRLFAIHRITLKDGVSPEQFESFVRDEYKVPKVPGWRDSIAKGDRGKDVGTFFFIAETDVATRERDYPRPAGQLSEATKAELAEAAKANWERVINTPEQKRLEERLDALMVMPTALTRIYTDYVVIAE